MLGRIAQRVRTAPPKLVLAIGWLAAIVYAYPGQMTAQAFQILRQSRVRYYSDDYAPAMSKLWGYLELVVAGPTSLLCAQTAMFVIGAYAILQRALTTRAAAWVTAGLVAFPPILVTIATISTHSLMASLLVLGAGGLVSSRRRLHLASLAPLLVATAVQPSALVATLPLVLWLFVWRVDARRRRLHALAAWSAITLAALGFDAIYTHGHIHMWTSQRASYDIAGTLAFTDDLPDAEVRNTLAGTGLRVVFPQARARWLYDPADPSPLVAGDHPMWQFPLDGSAPTEGDALARAARTIAVGHPLAYVKHRVTVFGELLWLTESHPEAAVPPRQLGEPARKVGIPSRSSEVQDAATCVTGAFARHTPLFPPWLYLVLAFVLLVPALHHRDVLALLASGLAFEASLLVTATTPAYAASAWLIACTSMAIVMLVVRRART